MFKISFTVQFAQFTNSQKIYIQGESPETDVFKEDKTLRIF